jgi:hypothetical protein
MGLCSLQSRFDQTAVIYGPVGVAVKIVHDFQNPALPNPCNSFAAVIFPLFEPNEVRIRQSF